MDGNFNPFFATSATDSEITAITQIGMLTTDAKGNLVCGEDQPTVALDYRTTMKDADGNETTNASVAETTEYEFIIKNDVKFSDGKPLTIQDVLFNLYVYLDPAYMGSATLYSTDIVGLQKYRKQDPTLAGDAENTNSQQQFYAAAEARVVAILDYLDPKGDGISTPQILEDIETTKKLFRKEAEEDWTANQGTLEAYEDEYTFTEDWQIYYFVEGIVGYQYAVNANGVNAPVKDENGKYVTTLDDANDALTSEIVDAQNDAALVAEYMTEYGCDEATAKYNIAKDIAINNVYNTYTSDSKLSEVLQWWKTGTSVRTEFAMEAQSEYFDSLKEGDSLAVPSIDGITTGKTSNDYDGNVLAEEHDVLKVVINDIDPKAIYNFSFSVAPMHYYSNAETIASTPYGVKFADKDFFNNVLQDPNKNAKPVGAGVYMATDENGSDNPAGKNFYKNNWVYYKRNPNFETVGDGLHNAYIKYLRYRVVNADQIRNALATQAIDFGEPNATVENLQEIGKYDHLSYQQYRTNGYGYVGINPKYVPDIEVRQAIMMAMDTLSIISNYYTGDLAQPVFRSMSRENWAYPEDAGEYYSFTTNKNVIKAKVESAGWTLGSDGVYAKDGKRLKITFTIAGETTDHPAYSMFETAAALLNECGFEIHVTTDITALKKLATGDLQVWAAAWSSTIDPDMYQVYHKDSTATSVKNWGYPTILADTTGQFTEEQEIIEELSALIEEGREYLSNEDRMPIYHEALDLVMELAVELPTYQRNDLVVYNKEVIKVSSLNQNPTAYSGVVDKLWEINYN